MTGKSEKLEPIKIPIAERVTREIRSEMEHDIRSVMSEIAERAEQQFIHEAALALAKRPTSSQTSRLLRNFESKPNRLADTRAQAQKPREYMAKAVAVERQEQIFTALASGYKGMPYCKLLNRLQLFTRASWQAGGCPRKYPEAYANDKWRDRVSDEKYKYQLKFNDLAESEKAKYRLRASVLLSKYKNK